MENKQLTIKLKRLGKKRVKTIDFEIENPVSNLKDLITECVSSEVNSFNKERDNPSLISFLTPKEIEEQSEKGKISFNDNYNKNKVKIPEAVENAELAFKDGLFVVFIDDNEIKKFNQNLNLEPESEISFIRMTFLVGTYW
ncbi:MAG TPA: hypothetical protein DDZ39_08225 [Flavobacteriaceae bacterium]|jgi:hypothetical protein|nr:hypothetical protein [Flavobacteriaceae bacterium]